MAALCSTNFDSRIGAEHRPSKFVRLQFMFKAFEWQIYLMLQRAKYAATFSSEPIPGIRPQYNFLKCKILLIKVRDGFMEGKHRSKCNIL
jgi:hypothetical protein